MSRVGSKREKPSSYRSEVLATVCKLSNRFHPLPWSFMLTKNLLTLAYAIGGIGLFSSAANGAFDALEAGISKGVSFQQTSADNVLPHSMPAAFFAWVRASGSDTVTNASLVLPNFSIAELSARPEDITYFGTETLFASVAALDDAYPNGQYVIRINGRNDGFHAVPLSLASNTPILYPTPPVILNFNAAQAISPAADFTLSWGSFSSGTTRDAVSVWIWEADSGATVWQTPTLGQPGQLDGLATSVSIPANTLPVGIPLQGSVLFDRAVTMDTNTYPGVSCFSTFYTYTTFPMAAQEPRPPDVLRAGVRKGLFYEQTAPASVVPVTGSRAANFNAYVEMASSNAVSIAEILRPDFASQALPQTDGDSFSFSGSFNSQASMDLAFPNGQYVMQMTGTHDGYHAVPLLLTNDVYPNPPQVLVFNEAQGVNISNQFTVAWSAFTTATAADYVQVRVSFPNGPAIWQTPAAGQPGSISGMATSGAIPAYTLPPGMTLSGSVVFAKSVSTDDTTYPGVRCAAVYYTMTTFRMITAGEADTVPPSLVGAYPSPDEVNVPRNAGLVLMFSEPMRTNYCVEWGPAGEFTNYFDYTWNADRTVLFCTSSRLLPEDGTIGYNLNPFPQPLAFQDLYGNYLAMDVHGSFMTGTNVLTPDVSEYAVYKGVHYVQTNAGPAALKTTEAPFFFGVSVEPRVAAAVTNATLSYASGPEQPLPTDWGQFELEPVFATSNQLAAAYPDGNYTVTMHTTHDGVHAAPLNLSGIAFPVPARISNWTEAQSINSSNSFTLTWDSFSNASAGAVIQLTIRIVLSGGDEEVISTPPPGSPDALPASVNSYTIPAGILSAGRTYSTELMFINLGPSNAVAYPGVAGLAAYVSINQLGIRTAGAPVLPRIMILDHDKHHLSLRVSGVPNVPYTIESADSVQSGLWFHQQSQRSTNGIIDFADWSIYSQGGRQFYRVREGW